MKAKTADTFRVTGDQGQVVPIRRTLQLLFGGACVSAIREALEDDGVELHLTDAGKRTLDGAERAKTGKQSV